MRVEKLGLEHKDLLAPKFSSLNVAISEYSFANVYLFRNIHEYEVVFTELIYIRGKTRDGVVFYMPTEPIGSKELLSLKKEIGSPVTLFPIPDEWLERFPGELFIHEFSQADADYLYDIEKMRTYSGNHLAGQRNHVHQFNASYEATTKPLNLESIKKAIDLLKLWNNEDQESDFDSCMEALNLLPELGLEGTIYVVDGNPIGFIIGEFLNRDVYVIHFAKADKNFKGVYPYMYQQYALNLNEGCKLINLEQDLGVEGLRKSKLSYQPIKIATKWRIRPI